jgi:small-conductance mechanosensitive channel
MGTVLSWISFLWLQQALDGLTRLAVGQHERVERAQPVRFPLGAALKLAGRYILVAVAAYATITYLQVPVFSVLAGLFALGAAAMSEGIYEAVARKP